MSKPLLQLRRPARILIAVRESPIANMIAEVLSIEGYDVVATPRADEALRIARESSDGLIIFLYVLDPSWPGNEGLATFTTARPPDDGHIVMLLTASPDYLKRADEFHADEMFIMPFTVDQLIEKTARAQRRFRTKERDHRLR
jgi:DNA-binding response OmpR family regulator